MLPIIPQDKANHFAYGAATFTATYTLTAFQQLPALPIAAAAVALVAFGKEALDWLSNRRARAAGFPAPHGVELLDALATLAGGALCAIPLLM